MPDVVDFPKHFQAYSWNNKHALFGYRSDEYDHFDWILSLECRFKWLRENCVPQKTSSIYLVREMIQWGGSQNGVLQKFDDRIGEVNLQALLSATIAQLENPQAAIQAALRIPGMGLTYASKLLRFLDPIRYGAIDSKVRRALAEYAQNAGVSNIYDGNDNNMINGYCAFIEYLRSLQRQLRAHHIARPACRLEHGECETGWRLADIEMVLFSWAVSNEA